MFISPRSLATRRIWHHKITRPSRSKSLSTPTRRTRAGIFPVCPNPGMIKLGHGKMYQCLIHQQPLSIVSLRRKQDCVRGKGSESKQWPPQWPPPNGTHGSFTVVAVVVAVVVTASRIYIEQQFRQESRPRKLRQRVTFPQIL